jgi:hypothetical protein
VRDHNFLPSEWRTWTLRKVKAGIERVETAKETLEGKNSLQRDMRVKAEEPGISG